MQVQATTQRRKLSTFSGLSIFSVAADFKKLELRIKTFFYQQKKVQRNKLKKALAVVVVKRSSIFFLCWSANIVGRVDVIRYYMGLGGQIESETETIGP